MIEVIKFYANWCLPCKTLTPTIDGLRGKVNGVTFTNVNVDEQSEIASAAGVRNIPLVIIKKNGVVVDRISGVNPESVYLNKIQAA
tara:strand:+ start:2928 stop:3185 length:258 start_codon:yes stop_codon:yes gene_type:complete